MTDENQTDLDLFQLRLPLWAVTDAKGLREQGLSGAIRDFQHDIHGRFLDLFIRGSSNRFTLQ